MSNENRDRLVAGILFYKEAIKNSDRLLWRNKSMGLMNVILRK